MIHPFYGLLLNSPVSPTNEPIKAILPMHELLMLLTPFERDDDDVAAIWGSSIGVLMPLLGDEG